MADQIENQLNLAEDLIGKGRVKDAIPHLAKILSQHPNHIQTWYLLGICLDEPDKKKFAFEQALKLSPQHQGAQKQLDILNGEEITPEPEAGTTGLDQALTLIQNGEKSEAKKILREYLDKYPRDDQGWYLLGLAFNDPTKKANAFKRVLRLNPTHQKAYQQLRNLEKHTAIPVADEDSQQISLAEESGFKSSTFFRLVKYTLGRAATISLTIIVGVFFSVLIANKLGQLDQNIYDKLSTQIRHEVGLINTDEKRAELADALANASEESGLNLPFLPRHLLWTLHALTFDWGNVMYTNLISMYTREFELNEVSDIILDRLPNSLLLIGASNLFIFLVGIPLSLRISRHKSEWQDRLFSFLAPISSIPSWVHAIILILIFAVELRLLPPSGMFDIKPPDHKWEYIFVVGRHMILPVTAIILSLIFQLVYTWRTFFLIYADEDYVDLARAKGLLSKVIEKKYILRPAAPFVITSFMMTLVGFWQMTIALEVVFSWPGIGSLYINSLPNFWGDSMFPGEMIIAVSLVVLFAYMLGITVLVLDVVYAMVDPRVRVGNQGLRVRLTRRKTQRRRLFEKRNPSQAPASIFSSAKKTPAVRNIQGIHFKQIRESLRNALTKSFEIVKEMRHYPSAIVGLLIILVLIISSLYAVIAIPYSQIGTLWYTENFSGVIRVPKLAQPAWTNIFREKDLASTIIISSQDPNVKKVRQVNPTGSTDVQYEFTFDYDYDALPDEIILRLSPTFIEKRPFVNLTWITPDQRELEFKGFSVQAENDFKLSDYIPQKFKVDQAIKDARPVNTHGNIETLRFFVPPESEEEAPVPGKYTLHVDGLIFEEGGDLKAELVILGQVYGLAGTDLFRRDLLVPLLWGMPFALLFGLLGATITTILSMLLAASGVWFGGWIDGLTQRVNEAVMIMPIIALAVMFYAFFHLSIWTILGIMVLLNIFGSPTKAFRAAFLQVRESPFVEAAQAYGATNRRIILRYMIPRIIPVLIPQLVALIPSFVFLEATLGLFNINSSYPTWGKVIHDALVHGVSWGSRYWVLEPIGLLLLTGFAFAMVGFALDQILNPRLKGV